MAPNGFFTLYASFLENLLKIALGASMNYVDKILRIFYPLSPLLTILLQLHKAYVASLTFGWSPPPACQLNLWMPIYKLKRRTYALHIPKVHFDAPRTGEKWPPYENAEKGYWELEAEKNIGTMCLSCWSTGFLNRFLNNIFHVNFFKKIYEY